jgi:hypothetical protein
MGTHLRWLAPRLAAAVLALGLSTPARATLGEVEATVARDAATLSMTAGLRAAPVRGARSVRELRSGLSAVRQYSGADGTVFAVAWEGPVHPDLDTLLGAHAKAYRAALAGPRTARGPRRIVAGNLVVEFGGHGRSLHGRAYLSDAVPAGASLDDVR